MPFFPTRNFVAFNTFLPFAFYVRNFSIEVLHFYGFVDFSDDFSFELCVVLLQTLINFCVIFARFFIVKIVWLNGKSSEICNLKQVKSFMKF